MSDATRAVTVPGPPIIAAAGILKQIAAQRAKIADLWSGNATRGFHQARQKLCQFTIALNLSQRDQCTQIYVTSVDGCLSEFGNVLQIDDIMRRHRLVLQVIEKIAAAGKKCPVAAVTGTEFKCLADRARVQ